LILAIPSDSTIRRSLSFTHIHTGQGVQEQSEIPTLFHNVKPTIWDMESQGQGIAYAS